MAGAAESYCCDGDLKAGAFSGGRKRGRKRGRLKGVVY